MSPRVSLFALLVMSFLSFSGTSIAYADGDISVSVRRGALRITGGRAEGQTLHVSATSTANRYKLETNSGTTINGAAGPIFVEGVTGNTDIRMSANQSIILLTEGVFSAIEFNGNLNISASGRTSNLIMLDSVICYENISVASGSGVDVVMMGHSGAQGNITIRTGNGDDTVAGFECFPNMELLVDGGSGNDILMFENTNTTNAIFRGAAGNDLLGWESSILLPPGFELEFDGAAGTDQYFNGTAVSPSLRRMEGGFPGDYDDLWTLATARDEFYLAALIWAIWGLDS